MNTRNTEQYRGPGWWLPAPARRYEADNGPQRDARFRWVGAWVIRLWILICISFAGLMWSDPHISKAQAFFGSGVFTGVTGILLAIFMSLAWFMP